MTEPAALLADLRRQVALLADDLRAQVSDIPEVGAPLHGEYDRAFTLGRTAAGWTAWRDERVTQAAVAWVLGTVFVRFCEDNGLLATGYLAGRSVEAMILAEEAQEEFFRENPAETDRGWLLRAFEAIGASQAGGLLFDRRHNALYQIPVSHDAAKALIAFWRRRDEAGRLAHGFGSLDTRFLGDLYEELSESARDTYALRQTPEFVEEFLLDRTLTPAIAEFGHDVVTVVDPACGSGHFVLGAFHRLLREWAERASARDVRERVRLALRAVHGVDVNPFAVAIARFRLFIAALRAAGFDTLEQAGAYDFPINLAIGDSLIKARQLALPGTSDDELRASLPGGQEKLFSADGEQLDMADAVSAIEDDAGPADDPADPADDPAGFAYATEDVHEFPGILATGTYHVVVGNPPYITVKDSGLNGFYRGLYSTCSGQYHLSVPFTQRFFELARKAGPDGRGGGYVGEIIDNGFMKREFGKKLIEGFFADEVELTHVIDTSGAYLPGHGTPTVILFGRNRKWKRRPTVRALMSVRGEPGVPPDPAQGHVWQAILDQLDHPGSESEWLSATDHPRERFETYPWSLSGGGASDLKNSIDARRSGILKDTAEMGVVSTTGDDDSFLISADVINRFPNLPMRRMVEGDEVRDYALDEATLTVWPYADEPDTCLPEGVFRWLWPNRRGLQRRKRFSIPIEKIDSVSWFEYRELYPRKLNAKFLIAFCTVTTHNHFVLCRSGAVFNRHAPVVRLFRGQSEDDHLKLLGVLNSSTACFWLKQVCQNKGNGGIGGGIGDEPWEPRYEFTSTKLKEFPLPKEYPLGRARELDESARRLGRVSPAAVCAAGVPTEERLAEAHDAWTSTRARMIALQEELDWEVYRLYGLLDDDLTAPVDAVPELRLGERAFEIALARKVASGEATTVWFARHGSTPITEVPAHWPEAYRAVLRRRVELIESDRDIGLLERPEHKRRWALVKDNKAWGWEEQRAAALRAWLLDRCEARELWFHELDGQEQPRMLTTAALADLLRRDPDVVSVAELYAPGRDLERVIADLVAEEHVPYLARLRHTASGMAKRAEWERVWEMQREEDAAQVPADAAREAVERQQQAYEETEAEDEETRQRAMDELIELEKRRAEAEAAVKAIRDAIPVPPRYGSGDFRAKSYWHHRGKLDVPKERFVSYPHAGRDGDRELSIGWAGWDHRERAQALATLTVERERGDGWGADRLTPLLAGLRELLPWVRQWHDEFDPVYAATPADIYGGFLDQTTSRLHLTDDDLTAWRPPTTRRGRGRAEGR